MLIVSPDFTVALPVEANTAFNFLELATPSILVGHRVSDIVLDALTTDEDDERLTLTANRVLEPAAPYQLTFDCSTSVDDVAVAFKVCFDTQTGNVTFETAYQGKFQLLLIFGVFLTAL
jgi:hypothetical protein